MKKNYIAPEMICVTLEDKDVIATSLEGDKEIQVASDTPNDESNPIWNIN